jgi:flagellar motility protein MotE (MotC chaperone)
MVAQSHGNQEHFRKAIDAAQHERNQLIEKLKDLEKIKQRLAQLDTLNKGNFLSA